MLPQASLLSIRHVLASLIGAVLLAGTAAASDNFPGTTISGSSGSVTASNVAATSQPGEPATFGGGAIDSIWYSWTAPADGNVTFQTCVGSTNFDTTLQTFTGSAVNALSRQARNDDSCGLLSVNTLPVSSGTTYRVQVDGYGNNTGTFTLSWNFSASLPPTPTGVQACTALTGAWSGGSATSGGIGVTRVLGTGSGASWDPSTAGNMNTINGWSSTAVQGQSSAVETFNWSNSGDTGTYTLNFGKSVTNPVIHFDRIGGFANSASNSSIWTLTSPGTLYRLAGPSHFETLSNNSFFRTIGQSAANTAESSLSPTGGTAPGSIMIEGTMSSVTFDVTGDQVGGGGAGDAVEIVVCVPQADLSLEKLVDDPAPNVGDTVTYTLRLTNNGPQDSPNTEVTDLLPAGLDFDSATPSQGIYDDASGVWTLGTLANGDTATLDIVANVTAAGTITNDAEITAADYADPDSDPGDGGGDDFASVDITATVPPSTSIEWVDWTSATAGTLCSGTISVTATSGGTAAFLDNDDTFNNGDDVDGTIFTPELVVDSVNVSGRAAGSFTFSQAVSNPRLHFYQLDANDLTFSLSIGQAVSLLSSNVGQSTYGGSSTCGVGLIGPVLNGCDMDTSDQNTGASSPKSPDASVIGELEGAGTVYFSGAFTTIAYASNGATNSDNTTRWAVGVDASTCPSGTAELSGAKSFTLFDGAASGNIYALPGEDVIYTLTVTNIGDGATDADTVFLVDEMPPEVAFFNDDIDTDGPNAFPGSDPVGFVDSGSGLSFLYSRDVRFSNSATQPATFADCGYVPSSPYDPAVTYICFNPKGAMATGDPDPAFSVSFRAGIR